MSRKERPTGPFDAAAPRVFSIDAGRPFLDDLAEGLTAALGADLPRAEIFLPTRRALRAAADAILDAHARNGRRAALLPRFRAIGDIDEDELIAFSGDAADEISGGEGDDTLRGQQHSDRLTGDGGNDRLEGGGWVDYLFGNDGVQVGSE